jgi:Ricin-type beta-trefoil lectin domain-like
VSSSSGYGENADAYGRGRLFRLPEGDTDRPSAYPGGVIVPPPPDFGLGAPDAAHPDVAGQPPAPPPVEGPDAVRDGVPPPDDGQPDPTDDGLPDPGASGYRPARPVVVAAVVLGGAILLAIPFLLVGTGSHDKQHRSASAADAGPSGDAQPPPPPFPASPTPVPTPSLSPPETTPKATPKPAGEDTTAKHTAPGSGKDGFKGAANVLLKNAQAGRCADVPGYQNGYPGLFLQTGYCTYGASDNQVWSLSVIQGLNGPDGAPLFLIRNTRDGYCIDLPGGGAQATGTDVGEQSCRPTNADNELWYRTHVHGDLYRIRNHASHGLCFGVAGRSDAVEKRLEIHTCGSGDTWSWPSGG